MDTSGNLFIADELGARTRKVSASGIITTVAGNGVGAPDFGGGFSGEGGPAISAQLSTPSGVAVDASGNFFIADPGVFGNRVTCKNSIASRKCALSPHDGSVSSLQRNATGTNIRLRLQIDVKFLGVAIDASAAAT